MPAKKTTKKTRQQEFDAAMDRALLKDDAREVKGLTHEMKGQAVLDEVQRTQYVPTEAPQYTVSDKGVKDEIHYLANIIDTRLKEIRDAIRTRVTGGLPVPDPTYPPPPPGGFHPAPLEPAEPESFEPPDAEVVTLEDIHRAFMAYVKKNGETKVKAILKKFGVDRASQVEPGKLPALLKAFEA